MDKEFLASLRQHGVLVPITAVRSDVDGRILARNGRRRSLGAREVGLSSVPVYVLPATASDETAEAVERIVHQIVTNDQKADLTDAQRARGIQQMIDAGLSATKVAKKLSVSRDTVKAATTAAGSAAAMDALNSGQLSLVEAAALTEFEDAGPAVLQQLLDAAGGPQFDHTVAQLRQQRETAKAYAEAAESYAVQGYRVLDEQPAWRDTTCVELRGLRTADGDPVTEEAVTNPAYWAVWLDEEVAFVDRETGERVDEDAIDFATEDDPKRDAEEGLRHFSTVMEKTVFTPGGSASTTKAQVLSSTRSSRTHVRSCTARAKPVATTAATRPRRGHGAKPKRPKRPSGNAARCLPSTSSVTPPPVCAASLCASSWRPAQGCGDLRCGLPGP